MSKEKVMWPNRTEFVCSQCDSEDISKGHGGGQCFSCLQIFCEKCFYGNKHNKRCGTIEEKGGK